MTNNLNNKIPIITKEDFLSGAVAGTTQIIIGHPLDTLKVRYQTSKMNKVSLINMIKELFVKEGFTSFYKGSLSPLILMSFAFASQFTGYELAKRYFTKLRGCNKTLTIRDLFCCGAVGGVFISFVINPMELFKIKMQIQKSKSSAVYSSSIDVAYKIFLQDGIKGIYKGYSICIISEMIGTGCYFSTYESLMQKSEKIHKERKKIPKPYILLYGALAGIANWVAVYPLDSIKTKIQSSTQKVYFISVAKKSIIENGVFGLYRGLVPCLIRAPIVNAASFLTYEMVHSYLSNFNKL